MLALALVRQWYNNIGKDLNPAQHAPHLIMLIQRLQQDNRSKLSGILAEMLQAEPKSRPKASRILQDKRLTGYIPTDRLKAYQEESNRLCQSFLDIRENEGPPIDREYELRG